MRVELLYFDGRPTYRAAEKTLRGVLAQEDVEAEVELVAVNTDEEAALSRQSHHTGCGKGLVPHRGA